MSAHRVQTRWGDLDPLGHVGHTAVMTYLEAGRDEFLGRHGISRDEYVVGRCTISFDHEIPPSLACVTAECDLKRLGRSSLGTSERILDDEGRVLVEASFDLVLWDRGRRAPRPISPSERASLEEAGAASEGAPA